jgi:predicted nuclease with RNAse H fold
MIIDMSKEECIASLNHDRLSDFPMYQDDEVVMEAVKSTHLTTVC